VDFAAKNPDEELRIQQSLDQVTSMIYARLGLDLTEAYSATLMLHTDEDEADSALPPSEEALAVAPVALPPVAPVAQPVAQPVAAPVATVSAPMAAVAEPLPEPSALQPDLSALQNAQPVMGTAAADENKAVPA
jgi:hypothetical protein